MSEEEAQHRAVTPEFSSVPSDACGRERNDARRGRRRTRGANQQPPVGLSIEQEAAWRAAQSKRGKRHRGPIDIATQQLLDLRG